MNGDSTHRIPFYKEIGQYFAPDGSFDRKVFSLVFKQHIDRLRENSESIENFQDEASKWVETYVASVITHLKAKNMTGAIYIFVKNVVDRCVSLGIKSVSMPADLLENLFTLQPEGGEESEVHKDKTRTTQDEKRQKIFAAALKVFAEMGFHRATMDSIAASAGIGKGSLYRMFASKEDLLEQLLYEEYRKITRRIGRIFAANEDLIDGLQEMIEFWVAYINDNPVFYKLIQNNDLKSGVPAKTQFYIVMSEQLPMLKERIVSLNREHKLKYMNFESLMYGIFGFVDGIVHNWLSHEMQYPLTREVPLILECVFNGFLSEEMPRHHFYEPIQSKDVENLSGER